MRGEKDWKKVRKLGFLSAIQHLGVGNTDIMFISTEMDRDFGDILPIPIYRPSIVQYWPIF